MRKPHKHAEIIKAWADGAVIQCRLPGGLGWANCRGLPSWHDDLEYRVRPEPLRYRIYELAYGGERYLGLVNEGHDRDEHRCRQVEASIGFVRWIHTEWQEVLV